ncbi:MAG TPA: oligosaccharide flippase family protein [Geomonas sp.]|nr:oligosaccharide flippase family protein [Geomonas sp.]
MSEKYRIFNNALFNTASWVFTVILSFVFLPYIVRTLGTEGYGLLVLVLSVIGYFAVLDLNLGDAVIKYVAEYHAENDMKKVNEVVGSVLLAYLVLGTVAGVAILLFSGTMVNRLLQIKTALQPAALFAFQIGSAGILLTMLMSALSAIPNALNRYDVTSKATMAMGLLTNLATVSLLYFGFGLREIVILNLLVSLLGIGFYALASKRLLPGLELHPVMNFSAIRRILKYGMFSTLSRLSSMMQFQGVRLLAGIVLGVSAVTFYVVPFSLVSRAMAITFRLAAVIFPVISGMQGQRDFQAVSKLYLKSSRLIFSVSTAICLPLFLFGGRFLSLWMGETFRQQTGLVMLLLTASLYMDSCTNVPSHVLNGLGMPKFCGYFSTFNAVINLLLVYPLSKWLGINGIALSFLVGHIIVAPTFVIFVTRKLKLPLMTLLKEVYLMPIIAGMLAAIPFLILMKAVQGMATLLFVMMAASALYLVICYVTGVFSQEEKEYIIGYLRLGKKGSATNVV